MTETSILGRILHHPLAALLTTRTGEPDCHFVGGIVRDAALGVATHDLDISIAAQGDALASSLAEESCGTFISLGGDRFSSYRVIAGDYQADIWDRQGGTLAADLERRDLTINSIACTLGDERLLDHFGGLDDLDSKTLRATKEDCFERDPLRVLRLARFRATLDGFRIEPATAAAARSASAGLERTATERIRDELDRMFGSAPPRLAFATLAELGALAVLVPGTEATAATRGLLESADRVDQYLSMLDTGTSGVAWDGEDRRTTAVALLLTVRSQPLSPTEPRELERRGLATRKSLRTAARLLVDRLPRDEDSRRVFILSHGPQWPLAAAVVAAASREVTPSAAALVLQGLQDTAREHPSLAQGLVGLLDGHAAARILGIEPGPAVGEALRALLRAQALGQVTSRDEAEAFLRKRAALPTSELPLDAG